MNCEETEEKDKFENRCWRRMLRIASTAEVTDASAIGNARTICGPRRGRILPNNDVLKTFKSFPVSNCCLSCGIQTEWSCFVYITAAVAGCVRA